MGESPVVRSVHTGITYLFCRSGSEGYESLGSGNGCSLGSFANFINVSYTHSILPEEFK